MKPAVLIYRSQLLPLSETFIAAQARALEQYRPVFAGTRRLSRVPALPGPLFLPGRAAARLLYRRTGLAPGFASRIAAQQPALVHAHFAVDAAEALPLVRALRVPLIVTLHGYDVMCSDAAHMQSRSGCLYLARRARLWERADRFLCVSAAIRQRALERGFPEAKLQVLPFGIDVDTLAPEPRLTRDPLVVFVGRLVEKKGCDILLEAMARVQESLAEARLVVVGEGPERERLERIAARRTQGTRFLGALSAGESHAWMRRARCLAAPSRTAQNGDAEGLPTVLAEALALGIPVASTLHSGIPELIRHDRDGLLAREGDVDGLAANLVALCQDDPAAERLRASGRLRVERDFNLRTQTARLEELYSDAIAAHASSLSAAKVQMPAQVFAAAPAPRLRRQAAWIVSGNGLATLCQAIYFVLIGRMLGAREYGAFAGVVALINVGSQFSSCGMEMVLLRIIARERLAFSATWARALLINACGCAVLLLALLLYGKFFLSPQLRQLVPYLVLADAGFGKVTQMASRALQGAELARWSAKLQAATNATRAVAAGALFLATMHAQHAVSAFAWARVYLGASAVVAVLAFALVTQRLGWPRAAAVRLRHIAEGLSFSFSSSAISVYNDIDKALLAGYGLLGIAGIYAAAYRVIDVVSVPIYSLFAAASPRLFRSGASEGAASAERSIRRLLRWSVPFGVLAALALAWAAPFMPRLFGHSFSGSVAVLRWLCLLPLLRALHYGWGTAITACASQWWRTSAQATVALLNLCLNLWLIPRYGWRGAAAASVASDGLLALLSFMLLRVLVARAAATRPPSPRVRLWRRVRAQ